MTQATNDTSAPKGEPWVWFTSLGLIVGLTMVAGLLALVLYNGFSVFWAPPVPTVKLSDGTVLMGQMAQHRVRPDSPASQPKYERQYQVGLRELNGTSYVWADEAKIVQEDFPAHTMGLERMENGPAFVTPIAFVDSKGQRVLFKKDSLEDLTNEVEHAAEIREELNTIQRQKIGAVNAKMEASRIDLRRAEDRGEPTAEIKIQIAAWKSSLINCVNRRKRLRPKTL